jgi:hypothetical protein
VQSMPLLWSHERISKGLTHVVPFGDIVATGEGAVDHFLRGGFLQAKPFEFSAGSKESLNQSLDGGGDGREEDGVTGTSTNSMSSSWGKEDWSEEERLGGVFKY